jgi:hypothetical protein
MGSVVALRSRPHCRTYSLFSRRIGEGLPLADTAQVQEIAEGNRNSHKAESLITKIWLMYAPILYFRFRLGNAS